MKQEFIISQIYANREESTINHSNKKPVQTLTKATAMIYLRVSFKITLKAATGVSIVQSQLAA